MSEGIETRHGCQSISSLVRALTQLPRGLGRFLPCGLGSHMSRLRQCSHGLSSRPLESCHHQCLKAICGVLGYPGGSAFELPDGTLKLRHCTDLFTMRLPPWSSPKVRNSSGKRQFLTPGHSSDPGGNLGKRVWLTRKTRPTVSSHVIPDPGASNAEEMEKIALPFPPLDWGVRWACLAIFFLALGLGEFCTWGRLEPALGGYRRSGVPAGQSSRRDRRTGAGPF